MSSSAASKAALRLFYINARISASRTDFFFFYALSSGYSFDFHLACDEDFIITVIIIIFGKSFIHIGFLLHVVSLSRFAVQLIPELVRQSAALSG